MLMAFMVGSPTTTASMLVLGVCTRIRWGEGVYRRRDRKTPAATADPITPATFGPIAAMRGLT